MAEGQHDILSQTEKFVDDYAKDGLRTLYLGKRIINEYEYGPWAQEKEQAMLATKNREEQVSAVDAKIEQNILLIGSTAIEDRLQDEVDKTIQFAKKAGIKVWVLTGDKVGTAINIGMSAGLLDDQSKMERFIIKEEFDHNTILSQLV